MLLLDILQGKLNHCMLNYIFDRSVKNPYD
jgi:hypothetical protein